MLQIRDVEGPKKTRSMETRLKAMEQQVFKCQGMVERGLNANHTMITEFTSNHKMDAIDIGKHLSRLYDRVDQLQGQIYDLQNQNCMEYLLMKLCTYAGRMFQPNKYPGLDDFYEQKHRAVLVERGEVPPLLRLRGHNQNESLLYDPRYEHYFRRMDLLQFVLNFKGTPQWLNAMALIALTDRWRPNAHSFHLPLGEMTITLEDIAMITGLPIEAELL
ncbi:hypothetical protein D1007_41797 [Hordeum vulgare]|nr:hypothetical protein D1007_41797 [Hordeum vulgare]